jgi:sialidase-1
VSTINGTLVAFGEARVGSCSDYAPTDLVVKRSFDAGLSWTSLSVLHSHHPDVVGNAAPVQLPKGHPTFPGRIVVPFTVNNSRVMVTHSDDVGLSWSEARDITTEASRPEWKWIGLGPPSSIALSSGVIFTPAYHSPFHDLDGTFTHAHVVQSLDGGETWSIGFEWDNITDPFFTNECQAAQINSTHVFLSARTLLLSRAQSLSTDGGLTFPPMQLVPPLPQPLDGVEGSIVWHEPSRKLFLSSLQEDSLVGQRYNLTLHSSSDLGQSWQIDHVIDPGHSAYSAMALLPNQSIGILFERSNNSDIIFVPDHISYTIAFEWNA